MRVRCVGCIQIFCGQLLLSCISVCRKHRAWQLLHISHAAKLNSPSSAPFLCISFPWPFFLLLQVLAFVQEHTEYQMAQLAGNSVHVDRLFLQRWMPELLEHLHYRIIDVSSLKECCRQE